MITLQSMITKRDGPDPLRNANNPCLASGFQLYS
jgi:hypothetical protein